MIQLGYVFYASNSYQIGFLVLFSIILTFLSVILSFIKTINLIVRYFCVEKLSQSKSVTIIAKFTVNCKQLKYHHGFAYNTIKRSIDYVIDAHGYSDHIQFTTEVLYIRNKIISNSEMDVYFQVQYKQNGTDADCDNAFTYDNKDNVGKKIKDVIDDFSNVSSANFTNLTQNLQKQLLPHLNSTRKQHCKIKNFKILKDCHESISAQGSVNQAVTMTVVRSASPDLSPASTPRVGFT